MFKQISIAMFGMLMAGSAFAAGPADSSASPMKWQEGKSYFLVEPPQPTASGSKIEVLEVFSYACIHCAHFQPIAEKIKKSLPSYAEYSYMPAIFNAQWEPFARAFYTAQSLGVLDKTHDALFNALHVEHKPLGDINSLAAWYANYGVNPDKFISASTSFEVESKMARSLSMVPKYGIDGTPSIIIDGKFRLNRTSAGSDEELMDLVKYLVDKAHREKALK